MTRIRMVTEAVRQVAQGLSLGANELEGLPSDLKNLSEDLSSAWQGGNAEHYAGEIARLSADFDHEIQSLLNLSSRVNNEVSEWENVDGSFLLQLNATSLVFSPSSRYQSPFRIPHGWLDDYRYQLKETYNSDAGMIWTAVGLGGVFIPTWAGGLVQVFADIGAGQNDYMMWAIQDWEKYDTFGEEIAASLFDSYFAFQKTGVLVSLDVVEIVLDTLDFIPGGYLVTTSAGLGFWTLGQVIGTSFDSSLESDIGIAGKELFVNFVGNTINEAIQTVDASFDPYINQIMTADPGGYSGSW